MENQRWSLTSCLYGVIIFTLCKCCISLPINDKEEYRQILSEHETLRHVGRRQTTDWELCEFGTLFETYDETCPNGATDLFPCNPGQLKIAECIGQDGDTSRICDPCPQKFFQSNFNRCTACHQCSECGANERIKEKCTDETDTICENIIPPDPVPTTPTTLAPMTNPPTPSSTQPMTFVPRITSDATENKTTRGVTYGNVDTTEVIPTSQAEKGKPPQPSSNDDIDLMALAITVAVLLVFLVVVVLILVIFVILKQRRKIRKLKEKLNAHTRDGIELKTIDSGLPSSRVDLGGDPPSTPRYTPPAEYENVNGAHRKDQEAPVTSDASVNIYQLELGQGEYMNSESQREDQDDPPNERYLVERPADTDSETGSSPKRSQRQEAVQDGAQSNGTGSRDSSGSDFVSTPGSSRHLSSSDLCHDGGGSGDHEGRDRLHGCRTDHADVHIPAAKGASDVHRKNFEASSMSGASGVEDSDGYLTGPEPDDPKTLHSKAPRQKEEGLPEANPLMQQPTGPEVDTNQKARKRKNIIPAFLKGIKRTKKEEYALVQQEDLCSNADEMVSEQFLDDLADHIDLKTLDKLCRELGVQDKDVSNMRITHQHEHGRELAFKMFMEIRSTNSKKFTYKLTIRAMRQSKNGHLVEDFIKKYNLR